MDVEIEDVVFPFIMVLFWVVGLYLGILYDIILISVSVLFVVFVVLIAVYLYLYRKKKRDWKLMQLRFMILLPAFIIVGYYTYLLFVDVSISSEQSLLLNGLVFFFLGLQLITELVYKRKSSMRT